MKHEKKKKGSKWLIVVLVILIVIACCAAFLLLTGKSQKKSGTDLTVLNEVAKVSTEIADEATSGLSATSGSNDGSKNGKTGGEDAVYQSGKYQDYPNDFLIPASSSQYISQSQYDSFGKKEAELAIQEIYARHGYIFSDSQYSSYFGKFAWYTPKYTASQFKSSWLNKYEKANIDTLTQYKKNIKKETTDAGSTAEAQKEMDAKSEETKSEDTSTTDDKAASQESTATE